VPCVSASPSQSFPRVFPAFPIPLSSLPLTPHFSYYFRVDGAILAYSLLAANGIYLLFLPAPVDTAA